DPGLEIRSLNSRTSGNPPRGNDRQRWDPIFDIHTRRTPPGGWITAGAVGRSILRSRDSCRCAAWRGHLGLLAAFAMVSLPTLSGNVRIHEDGPALRNSSRTWRRFLLGILRPRIPERGFSSLRRPPDRVLVDDER